MRKFTLPLIVAALMVFTGCSGGGTIGQLFGSIRARFSNGRKEVEKAFEAKKQAHSWRMTTELRTHPGRALETVVEVSCPDHERIVTTLGETTYESVRIGSDSWVKGANGAWSKQAAAPDAYPCGANPGAPSPWAMMNEGRDMTTVIATMAQSANAQVIRGGVVQIQNASCQQWVVTFQHPGGGGHGINYTLCIAPDGLPKQVMMGSGGMTATYSDWNQPINIQPPPNAAAATPLASLR